MSASSAAMICVRPCSCRVSLALAKRQPTIMKYFTCPEVKFGDLQPDIRLFCVYFSKRQNEIYTSTNSKNNTKVNYQYPNKYILSVTQPRQALVLALLTIKTLK